MPISVQDARNLLTKKLVAVYKEMPKPTGFLRSKFKPVESTDKLVSIEVRRGTEKVAVNVNRGERGNHNKVTRSTEKVIVPPYYSEFFGANDLRLYDVAIGNPTASNLAALSQDMAEEAVMVRDKIERAYEKQCADVFDSGVITLNDGTTIDYGRKASMVEDLSANPWSDNTVDPVAQITAACKKLRTIGKAQAGSFDMILGESAMAALLNNTKFQAQADLRRVDVVDLMKQGRLGNGGIPHGRITAGSYDVILYTYPEYYDVSGTSTPYINDKKIILMPPKTNFTMGFGAVPQLIENGGIPQKGAYLIQEFLDREEASHRVYVRSAGVAIPTAVDQIYTAQVLA